MTRPSEPVSYKTVLYDTTLRDGMQREGVSVSAREKLRIAKLLDELGVAYIEGGWPGSNVKDGELFERARDVEWKHAKLVAFGATRRRNLAVEDDPSLSALLAAGTSVCTIFGKSSALHVREVLRVSLDENLAMIRETVAYLVGEGREVIFDAEHFFDGHTADPSYAMQTLVAAVQGGASTVVLCDTNGGSFPWNISPVTREVAQITGVPVGIHAHDDSGCATANTLAAVRAGATHIQCTIHGWGERCGNANLCTIAPALEITHGAPALATGTMSRLTEIASEIARIAGVAENPHAPYVGKSAFAHKAGVHVSAIRRCPRAYEHIDPARVGNHSRVVVSELSGRGNVLSFAERLGWSAQDDLALAVLAEIESEEAAGYSFDQADGSVALRLERRRPGYVRPFQVQRYRVQLDRGEDEAPYAEVTVKTEVANRSFHTVGTGRGPVDAFDKALRKALEPVLPEIARIRLTDFSVRILDGEAGTGSTVRVWIEHSTGSLSWGTVGASDSVFEAAHQALVDGLEHGLRVLSNQRSEAS